MQQQMSPTLRCSVDTVRQGHHPLGYLYDTTNITTIMKMNKPFLRIDQKIHDIYQGYTSESFFLPRIIRITARMQRRRTETQFFIRQDYLTDYSTYRESARRHHRTPTNRLQE